MNARSDLTDDLTDDLHIHIGTGGYSNPDWLGLLYPKGTKSTQMLAIYAQNFDMVELNTSFYHMPTSKTFEQMRQRSGGQLKFCIKLPQRFSHQRDFDAELLQHTLHAPEPLRESGQFALFLAQFPHHFARTLENRRYLQRLCTAFAHQPLALEFRHASWDIPEVQASLRALGLIWVSPDYPVSPMLPSAILRSSGATAYIRLHGRNIEQWWSASDAASRHDYAYSLTEIHTLAQNIQALQQQEPQLQHIWISFNNTTKGHALRNIPMLRQALGLAAPASNRLFEL